MTRSFLILRIFNYADIEIYKNGRVIIHYDKEHAAGVTGRQRMLSSPRNLILPLSFRRSVLLCFEFVFRFMAFEMFDGLLLSFFSFIVIKQSIKP